MGDVTYQIIDNEFDLYDNVQIEMINNDENDIGELIVKGISLGNGYYSSDGDISNRF